MKVSSGAMVQYTAEKVYHKELTLNFNLKQEQRSLEQLDSKQSVAQAISF
jgi:hypothetical protein